MLPRCPSQNQMPILVLVWALSRTNSDSVTLGVPFGTATRQLKIHVCLNRSVFGSPPFFFLFCGAMLSFCVFVCVVSVCTLICVCVLFGVVYVLEPGSLLRSFFGSPPFFLGYLFFLCAWHVLLYSFLFFLVCFWLFLFGVLYGTCIRRHCQQPERIPRC